jgi:hypothetical protein
MAMLNIMGLQYMVSIGKLSAEEAARRTVKFAQGANAVVIVDSYLTDLTATKFHHTDKQQKMIY